MLAATCRVEIEGAERVPKDQAVIFCGWHEHTIAYIASSRRLERREAVIVNSRAYAAPFVVFARWYGAVPLLSGGGDGNGVVARTVDYLKRGYSTNVTPDAPRGPRRALRNGVLHMARESGALIVPVQVSVSARVTFPWSWDQKYLPIPFATIRVQYLHPIDVPSFASLPLRRAQLIDSLG